MPKRIQSEGDVPRLDHFQDLSLAGKLSLGAQSTVEGNPKPDTDDLRDLGTSANRWRNLYIVNNPNMTEGNFDTIRLGNSTQDVVLTRVAADTLGLASGDKLQLDEISAAGIINNIVFIDGVKYAATQAGLVSAIAAAGANGMVVIPSGTSITIDTTTPVSISNSGVTIRGMGFSSIAVTGTGNVFNVSGAKFRLEDLLVVMSQTGNRTTGALISASAAEGAVRNVHITGNASFTNGIGFDLTNAGADVWEFDNPRFQAGTWAAMWVTRASTGTLASTHITNPIVYSDVTVTTAVWDVDTGTDTLIVKGGDVVPTGPVILCRNTLAGTSPRWIRFVGGISIEAGAAATAITLTDAHAFQYRGYIASSLVGVAAGAAVRGADISHTQFINIEREAVTVANGALNVDISHNFFEDISQETHNTYDIISIAANTNTFNISHNTARATGATTGRYGVTVAAGTSTGVIIKDNDFSAGVTTGNINNNATGAVQYVESNKGNQQDVSTSDKNARRFRASKGTALVAGDFALHANFGSGATVSAVAATDQGGRVTITTGSTAGANPTATLTFKDGTWTNAPAVTVSKGDLVAPAAGNGEWRVTSISATAAVFTYDGTPSDSTAYVFDFVAMGR